MSTFGAQQGVAAALDRVEGTANVTLAGFAPAVRSTDWRMRRRLSISESGVSLRL
jgi:hypothetical protein